MPGKGELVAAHHLGGQVRQVPDIRLLLAEPAEQVVEVMVVLTDREWAEIAIDLAGFEEAAHTTNESRGDRWCLRWGRGGDGGHAAGRILRLGFELDSSDSWPILSRYI